MKTLVYNESPKHKLVVDPSKPDEVVRGGQEFTVSDDRAAELLHGAARVTLADVQPESDHKPAASKGHGRRTQPSHGTSDVQSEPSGDSAADNDSDKEVAA